MADSGRKSAPDPLGKRALFWAAAGGKESHPSGSQTVLPVGKRALYSGARPEAHSVRDTSDNPLVDEGSFVVECQGCHQTSHIGALDLLIFQFPFAAWLPRGKYDRRMTCPACRRRNWCSVSLRRG